MCVLFYEKDCDLYGDCQFHHKYHYKAYIKYRYVLLYLTTQHE